MGTLAGVWQGRNPEIREELGEDVLTKCDVAVHTIALRTFVT